MSKDKKNSTLDKLLKKLPAGFAEEADAMDSEQLKNVIVESSENIRVAKHDMANNEKVIEMKEALAEARGPYRDAISAQNAKVAYALHILESKGLL